MLCRVATHRFNNAYAYEDGKHEQQEQAFHARTCSKPRFFALFRTGTTRGTFRRKVPFFFCEAFASTRGNADVRRRALRGRSSRCFVRSEKKETRIFEDVPSPSLLGIVAKQKDVLPGVRMVRMLARVHAKRKPLGRSADHTTTTLLAILDTTCTHLFETMQYYGGLRPLSNGQFHQQTGSRGRGNQRVHQGPPLAPVPRPREIPPPAELRTKTIRNDVNLKKSSLVLLPVEEGSSRYAVEFTFDAAARCYVSIFLNVAEVPSNRCSLHPSKNLCGRRISFGKGLRQKFSLDPEYAIDVSSALEDAEAKPSSNSQDFHNIVIRLETVQSEGEEGHEIDDLPPGSPFPRWVQSQTTYANIVKQDDGHYALRVKKQKIWVQGTSYELQEIYGMEPVMGEAVGDTEDAGQECVICLSEPRDTTVLPCRHMCMCNKCARMLREKSNNCPICRKPVESLLEIKVGRPVQETQVREESMAGTS